MANKNRGERDIKIGEETFTLVPNYDNFSEIESVTGLCLMDLTFAVTGMSLPIRHIATVIEICSGAKNVGPKMMEEGYLQIMQDVGKFLSNGIEGNQSGKAKAKGQK